MDYLRNIAVLDVETTGVNPERCAVLSVGMVTYRERPLEFYREYYPFDGAEVAEEALRINGFEPDKIARNPESDPKNVAGDVVSFMRKNGCNIISGENPSFDRDFVNAYAARYNAMFRLQRRTLDLQSVCISHMLSNGIDVPSKPDGSHDLVLDTILTFVGLGAEPRPHNALNGAKYEFEALCRLIYGKSVLAEFRDYEVPDTLLKRQG